MSNIEFRQQMKPGQIGFRLVAAMFLIAALPFLTACGAINSSTSSTKNQTYSTVSEFKDAYVGAGGYCPDWQQTDLVQAATESGNCSDSSVLSIYSSPDDAQQAASDFRNYFADSAIQQTILVGSNWILNSDDVSTVQGTLGGTIYTVGQ